MSSDVAICNRAGQIIGVTDRITSLSEGSVLSKAYQSAYELTRDTEQQKYFWKFCKTRKSLSPDTAAPETTQYTVQYTIPPDCLRVIHPEEQHDWQIEGGKILTNDYPDGIELHYIKKVTDPALFPPLFSEALSARLAYNVGEQLTNSTTLTRDAMERYRETISEARRADAFWIGREHRAFPTDSFLLDR
jgi:hypothetical protein